ncbi:MAG TPA: tryptophan-rich sensory protein [Bacteroidales bacterium]|nr:tryptophan-rich sensory protein [Bacteroidales bacterium]HPF02758.1 tryptophan-rich sensory protein [Bacteroidales bacterium]HPJ59028.1 tryptophan-rich sensory protein [Bacteroidales bacterium]HPR13242.1 tryptophan-rich sensory protein [Bacteroidales bacterium]HRW84718.1 tryptophan-rich sensory protein [Bacteroidales bacterium]
MIKYLNIVFFLVMIVMNYLANALPLNNKTTGQLSDALPNLFVPAGLTFSIWGVIYLLLAVFCVLQFAEANHTVINRIGWWFVISCLLNSLWIVAWHYQKLPFSLIIMLGMLVTLIYINMQIRDVPAGIIKASFGIYLGWICIATIANVTALLVHFKLNGGVIPEQIWTIIIIGVGLLITAVTLMRLQNPFIGLAVAWAFLGIYIKRQGDFRSIAITALVAMILILLVTLRGFISKKTGILT